MKALELWVTARPRTSAIIIIALAVGWTISGFSFLACAL
jgi:hypothetical protein